MVALDAAGKHLLVKDGGADEIAFTGAELARLSGHVDLLVHNHPSGLSFSRADVRTGVALGVRELVVFSRSRWFRLRRLRGAWPPAGLLATEIERV